MKKNKALKIIERELNIFKETYPKQKELLNKFATKIKFEIILDT